MTQRELSKIVIFVAAIVLLILSWGFFGGSGIAEPMFADKIENNQVSSVTVGIWSSLIEIGFSLITSAIGLLLFVLLKGANFISGILQPIVNPAATRDVDTTVGIQSAMMEDLSRVLLQAIVDKDKVLTIAIAEKIAGSKFLTDEPKLVSSFPVKGGDK